MSRNGPGVRVVIGVLLSLGLKLHEIIGRRKCEITDYDHENTKRITRRN